MWRMPRFSEVVPDVVSHYIGSCLLTNVIETVRRSSWSSVDRVVILQSSTLAIIISNIALFRCHGIVITKDLDTHTARSDAGYEAVRAVFCDDIMNNILTTSVTLEDGQMLRVARIRARTRKRGRSWVARSPIVRSYEEAYSALTTIKSIITRIDYLGTL